MLSFPFQMKKGRILDMKKKTKADVQKIGREFPLQNSMLCAAVLYGYDHGMTIWPSSSKFLKDSKRIFHPHLLSKARIVHLLLLRLFLLLKRDNKKAWDEVLRQTNSCRGKPTSSELLDGETQIFDYSLSPWALGMKDMSLFSLIMVDLEYLNAPVAMHSRHNPLWNLQSSST